MFVRFDLGVMSSGDLIEPIAFRDPAENIKIHIFRLVVAGFDRLHEKFSGFDGVCQFGVHGGQRVQVLRTSIVAAFIGFDRILERRLGGRLLPEQSIPR